MPATPSQTVQAPAGKKIITVRTTAFKAAGRRRQRGDREDRRRGRSRPVEIRRRGAVAIRASRTDLRQDRDLRRARPGLGGEFQAAREDRRQAACRGRRQPRARWMRAMCPTTIRSARPARWWRPTFTRGRHFRRHPASGRHEGFQGHRRHQQGRRSADLPGRRFRPGRRPVPGACRKWTKNWPNAAVKQQR